MEKLNLPPQSEANNMRHLPPQEEPPVTWSSLIAEVRAEIREVKEMIEERLGIRRDVEPLLDIKEVATRLGVSVRTVESLVADGKLKPIWIRGIRRFSPIAIESYIRSCARR